MEAIDPAGEMIAAVGRGPEGWGEDEMSVLPRHTKVVVTGNNRTKSVLVGLHGVVKKAVGLGGWHWLVISLCPTRNCFDFDFADLDLI